MSELDLTKPLRIKHSQERFYPCPDLTNDRWLHGLCLGFETGPIGMPKVQKFLPATVHRGELENIPPEPVKHVYYLYFNEADKGASLYAHNNYSPLFKPSMAKILIWVEEGKTKVEVCDD